MRVQVLLVMLLLLLVMMMLLVLLRVRVVVPERVRRQGVQRGRPVPVVMQVAHWAWHARAALHRSGHVEHAALRVRRASVRVAAVRVSKGHPAHPAAEPQATRARCAES